MTRRRGLFLTLILLVGFLAGWFGRETVAQRLKLSGMRRQKAGAQRILQLRVLRLSGVWDRAYQRVLCGMKQPKVWGQAEKLKPMAKMAA